MTQGVADPVLLQRAERTLERMERRLNQLSVEKADTRQQVSDTPAVQKQVWGSVRQSVGSVLAGMRHLKMSTTL